MNNDEALLGVLIGFLVLAAFRGYAMEATAFELFLTIILFVALFTMIGIFLWSRYSKKSIDLKKKVKTISEIPDALKLKSESSVLMGVEIDLNIPLYLPDNIRRRHVHIMGATGSGKTESVVLNFLKQDIEHGLGSIILDAKGDQSFIDYLKDAVDAEKLQIFDLSDENSLGYNPLAVGSPLEAAQRLFSSMNWSEEYYKSKALSALQSAFQYHYKRYGQNPTILDLKNCFDTVSIFAECMNIDLKNKSLEKEFNDVSGLRDQIRSLSVGHLEKLLSPGENAIDLSKAVEGNIIYFRLQSLLSPQAVQILGKLIIQHLNFIAGSIHRQKSNGNKLIPIYLDEFASFASVEFADLISKARSAGFALHFSHQSIGDLEEVSKGFLNRITDNSAIKIILRINDPDSAEFFARSFGTELYQKLTQKVTKSTNETGGELLGEGTARDAHQFRASPDTFKTLPTGVGSVLVAHGLKSSQGGSHVFKIQFPLLGKKKTEST